MSCNFKVTFPDGAACVADLSQEWIVPSEKSDTAEVLQDQQQDQQQSQEQGVVQ
jgi:hypothetical protein